MPNNTAMHSLIDKYFILQQKLDARITELSNLHESYMVCKKGCSSCCMNFGMLPIEYYAIQHALGVHAFPQVSHDDSCKFLKNGMCSIYAHRPFICRTQGLPIIHYNSHINAWNLLVCELNFVDVDDNFFQQHRCLDMDVFNEKLSELNSVFILEHPELCIDASKLIDVNEL